MFVTTAEKGVVGSFYTTTDDGRFYKKGWLVRLCSILLLSKN